MSIVVAIQGLNTLLAEGHTTSVVLTALCTHLPFAFATSHQLVPVGTVPVVDLTSILWADAPRVLETYQLESRSLKYRTRPLFSDS